MVEYVKKMKEGGMRMRGDIKSELHESIVKVRQLEDFICVLTYLDEIDEMDLLKREMRAFKKYMQMSISFERNLKEKKKNEFRMTKKVG